MEYIYSYESPYEHLTGEIVFPEKMSLADYDKYYKARKGKDNELSKDWEAIKAMANITIEHDSNNPPFELVTFASKCLNHYILQYLSPK